MPPPPADSRRSPLKGKSANPVAGMPNRPAIPARGVNQPNHQLAQAKFASGAPSSFQHAGPPVYCPAQVKLSAPPVYRPNVAAPLQRQAGGGGSPPVYRPVNFTQVGARLGFPHLGAPLGSARPAAQRQRVAGPVLVKGPTYAAVPVQRKGISLFSSPTIQPMESAISGLQKSYYSIGLTELECSAIASGQMVNIVFGPIHGSFTGNNLTGDLHVYAADKSQDIAKNTIAALKKMKRLMEYAAHLFGKDVRTAKMELRPTGGVVVKQMIEALAFMGLGVMDQYALNKKLAKLKERRSARIEELKFFIANLKQKRDRCAQGTPLEALHIVQHQLGPKHVPSPGLSQLLYDYEEQTGWRQLQEKIDALEQELEGFAGTRQGESMGEAFFDEHLYLFQTLIGRGGKGDFCVSAYGLANDLPEFTPTAIKNEFGSDENLLFAKTHAGDMARNLYHARLQSKRASLKILIYYSRIDELMSFVK
jgi:hypothetical protein